MNIAYRLIIRNVDDDADEYTFSHIHNVSNHGDARIAPLEGSSSTNPVVVDVLDRGGEVSAILGDTGGRLVLARRRALLQRRDGVGVWVTVAGGRIQRITMLPDTTGYAVRIYDERYIERNTTIHKTNSTALFPPGLIEDYANFRLQGFDGYDGGGTAYFLGRLQGEIGIIPNLAIIQLLPPQVEIGFPYGSLKNTQITAAIHSGITSTLEDDVVAEPNPTTPNFEELRLHLGPLEGLVNHIGLMPDSLYDSDLRVVGFLHPDAARVSGTSVEINGRFVRVSGYLDPIQAVRDDPISIQYIIVDMGRDWGLGAAIFATGPPGIRGSYLHMKGKPATPTLPLHIGGEEGVHPFEYLAQLYEDAGVKYDRPAMNALILDDQYERQWWRITRGETKLSDWVERNIYEPFCVVPLVNSEGAVIPTSMKLPGTQQIPAVDNLRTAQYSNVANEHPSWDYSADHQVTRIIAHYSVERRVNVAEFLEPILLEYPNIKIVPGLEQPSGMGLDGIFSQDETVTIDHDRIEMFGEHTKDIYFLGAHTKTAKIVVFFFAENIFQRFGDGAIETRLQGLGALADVNASDFISMNMEHFPNPQQLDGRGGDRIMQVLGKSYNREGWPSLTLLDAGPKIQPLDTSGLTVTLSTNATNPRHAVDVLVQGAPNGTDVEVGYQVGTPIV